MITLAPDATSAEGIRSSVSAYCAAPRLPATLRPNHRARIPDARARRAAASVS